MEHHPSALAVLLTNLLHLTRHGWAHFAPGTEFSVLERYDHLLVSVLAAILVLSFAFAVKRRLALVPGPLQQAAEALVGIAIGEAKAKIGHGFEKHVPLIGTLGLFILVNNLLGMVPGLGTGNANWNVPLAMAMLVFLYYNIMGMASQGFTHYWGHFMGPSLLVAPLLFPLEVLGLFIRIFSHSMRLFMNLGLEHLIGGVFFAIFPLFLPVPMMFLGLLVCLIQAYVFIVLTSLYIGGAVAVAEHH